MKSESGLNLTKIGDVKYSDGVIALKVFDIGTENLRINLLTDGTVIQHRVDQVIIKQNGSMDNKPSLFFIGEHPESSHTTYIHQLTLKMLSDILDVCGYTVTKK